MNQLPLFTTTHYLDRLPVRISTQCLREKSYLHFHQHLQMCYIRSGTIQLTIDGKEYTCPQNTFAVFLPYMSHMIDLTKSPDTPVVVFISFPESFLTKFGYNFFSHCLKTAYFEGLQVPFLYNFDESNVSVSRSLITDCVEEFSKGANANFKKIADAVAELFRLVGSKKTPSFNQKLSKERVNSINRVVAYIEENFSKKLTIEEMCPIAKMSRSTFTINFKSVTGLTFSEFLLAKRLAEVRNLLLRKHRQKILLDSIAKKVGLGDRTNLTRVFTKSLGVSPSQFCICHFDNQTDKIRIQNHDLDWLLSDGKAVEP
ncbi:MAG: AraC family transcriptional regulator [Oscillospiraceae bacterium]|nr:AraC family transcriptional regulator [Oscillospiraceae bacterium]